MQVSRTTDGLNSGEYAAAVLGQLYSTREAAVALAMQLNKQRQTQSEYAYVGPTPGGYWRVWGPGERMATSISDDREQVTDIA